MVMLNFLIHLYTGLETGELKLHMKKVFADWGV